MMIFFETITTLNFVLLREELKDRDCPTKRARHLHTQILSRKLTWKFEVKFYYQLETSIIYKFLYKETPLFSSLQTIQGLFGLDLRWMWIVLRVVVTCSWNGFGPSSVDLNQKVAFCRNDFCLPFHGWNRLEDKLFFITNEAFFRIYLSSSTS